MCTYLCTYTSYTRHLSVLADIVVNLQDAWREDAKDSAQLNLLPEAEGAPKVNTKQGKKAAASVQEVVASKSPAIQQGKLAVQHNMCMRHMCKQQLAAKFFLCRCSRVHN